MRDIDAMDGQVPDALILSGDVRIAALLAREGAIVIPAYSCRLDGFVNDTFTEYANPSVFRPPSVCRARLVSTLQDVVRTGGSYYLAFTMYTPVDRDEEIQVWIGHRQVAHARIPEPDNRLHLFVVPAKFRFKGGEPIRLVTSPTEGPCRIEHIVLLPRRPRPARAQLEIRFPGVDLVHGDGGLQAVLTWITSRPAAGHLLWRRARSRPRRLPLPGPRVNHEVILEGLENGRTYSYEIHLKDNTKTLQAVHKGRFKAEFTPPISRTRRTNLPLLLRRSAPASFPWPISTGVPFPQGHLGRAENLRLLDGQKREIPLQVRPLARWPDGSVRWALLDFQHPGQEDLRLEYGRRVERQPAVDQLQVVDRRAGITVTTGPLRAEFPRKKAVFPGIVSLRQPDGTYRRLSPENPSPAATLTDAEGTPYLAAVPEAVALEESGPERACIRVELVHRSRAGQGLFRSILRFHLFRGSCAVRVIHTFVNDSTRAEFASIRALSLRADFDLGTSLQGRLGRGGFERLQTRSLSLQQFRDSCYHLKQGRRTLKKGRRAPGRAHLRGNAAGVAVVVRHFWQNYPKGLTCDRDGVTLQICPPLDPDTYPHGGEQEERLYYYLLDGQYRFKCGVSRTHECWFYFHSPGETLPPHFGENAENPPLYSPPLEAFNQSQAVIRLPAKDPSPFPPYEAWVETARQTYAADRRQARAYGMLNYGDWFGERIYNWGNLEYDPSWGFLQEYLRGGHPDFFAWAEEASWHLADVDTRHHSPDSREIGQQYAHCVGHVGGYYPDGYRERAIFSGRWSPSHTWVEGLFLYHLLSGDPRAQEAAEKTCRLLVGPLLNYYDFTNCRNSGWHLIHLSAAYRATGRRLYLNAARLIVDRVLERQRPSGGWDRLLVPGHCYCHLPRHTGNAGFMVGILMTGLRRYYEATGERRVADAIVRAASYCIDAMWEPAHRAFRYTSCPRSQVVQGADMRILKGVATAYLLSGRRRFREVLEAGVQSALSGPGPRPHRGVGKTICARMRGAPQVLAALSEIS